MSDDQTSKKKYRWPVWWDESYAGVTVESDDPPQIHEKLLKIRKLVGGLQARKSEEAYGPKFAVKSAKDLMGKLREALDKEKCHVLVESQDVKVPELDRVPPNGKGAVFRSACTVTVGVRICAPDGSYVVSYGSGGAGDGDDKAVGKASTYAWKDAMIKALSLPDADLSDTDSDSDHGEVPQESENFQVIMGKIRTGLSSDYLKELADIAKRDFLPHERKAASDAIKARLKEISQ